MLVNCIEFTGDLLKRFRFYRYNFHKHINLLFAKMALLKNKNVGVNIDSNTIITRFPTLFIHFIHFIRQRIIDLFQVFCPLSFTVANRQKDIGMVR